jgi:uncharacterized protein YeaO (DUF488 family)
MFKNEENLQVLFSKINLLVDRVLEMQKILSLDFDSKQFVEFQEKYEKELESIDSNTHHLLDLVNQEKVRFLAKN